MIEKTATDYEIMKKTFFFANRRSEEAVLRTTQLIWRAFHVYAINQGEVQQPLNAHVP
jgi:hypothetical protein